MNILDQILHKLECIEKQLEKIEQAKPIPKGVLNAEETAERLKVSKQTVYDMINSGRLPYITIGGRKLIPEKQLMEWIDEKVKATGRNAFKNNIRVLGG